MSKFFVAALLFAALAGPASAQSGGDRFCKLTDPFGHDWSIATHVEDVPKEEMGKRAAEALCFDTWRARAVDVRVARIFNTYGPRMRHDDGRIVSNFIMQALRGQPITLYGDGLQTRDFTYVTDSARGIILAGTHENAVGRTINLGYGSEVTVNELATLVARAVGRPDATIVHDAGRPGDVLRSRKGITVEIGNTDAEGRLVLADALTYTQRRFKPRMIVDLATLTGAIVATLGFEHAGVFSNDDELVRRIQAAGRHTGERVWQLPLDPFYDKMIRSKIADMKNIGGANSGAITAAQFLKRFIENDTPWAHLDIAGVAWQDGEQKPTIPSWGTGWGVRLLNRMVIEHYET